MKKRAKKLLLARETVVTLGERDLVAPQGAASGFGSVCFCGSGGNPCFATQQYTCPC
jgi:hypothetical protein